MSRFERRAKREKKKVAKRSGVRFGVSPAATQDVARLFALEDCDHLTDEVIDHLVALGWPRTKLEEFRHEGGHYCAPRRSIIFPTRELLEGAPTEELLTATPRETTFERGQLLDRLHILNLT